MEPNIDPGAVPEQPGGVASNGRVSAAANGPGPGGTEMSETSPGTEAGSLWGTPASPPAYVPPGPPAQPPQPTPTYEPPRTSFTGMSSVPGQAQAPAVSPPSQPAPAPQAASASPPAEAPQSQSQASRAETALKNAGERWLVPLSTLIGAVVTLFTLLGQLPGVSGLSFVYNAIAPFLYRWRLVIIPLLLVLGVAALGWAFRTTLRSRRAKALPGVPRRREHVFWRYSAGVVLLLLALGVFIMRPAERVVGVLPYTPAAESQVDPVLGQELADYVRGALKSPDGLIKVVGVPRVAGESLSSTARRSGAQVLVDGTYALGKGSLTTHVVLYDAASDAAFGKPDDRTLLIDNIQTTQQEVGAALADQIDLASAVTPKVYASTVDCTSAYECYVVGRRYYLWFNEEGYNRAIAHYQAALTYDSQYARAYAGLSEAHILLSGLYSYEGKTKEMQDLWDQAGKESAQAGQFGPGLVESHRARAWFYGTKGLLEAARGEHDTIAKLSPPSSGFVLTGTAGLPSIHPSGDAESLWLLGNLVADAPAREALFKEALRLKPDLPQVHHDLGTLYFAEGKLDAAENEFNQALLSNPNMIYAHVALAQLELTRAMLVRASSTQSPTLTPTPAPRGATTGDSGAYLAEARHHIDIAVTQMPNLMNAVLLEATIQAAQGQIQPAIRNARTALQANPELGVWYNYSPYDDPALHDIPISALRQAIAGLPDYLYNYDALGTLYAAQGHRYQALQAYSDAVALDPHFGVGWYNLSVVQQWFGKYDLAVVSARRAVSETSNWANAYAQLGQSLLWLAESQRPDLAASAGAGNPVSVPIAATASVSSTAAALPTPLSTPPVPEGCTLQPAASRPADTTALLAEAESAFRKALEINPHNAVAGISLGQVLFDEGRYNEQMGNAALAASRYDEAVRNLNAANQEVNEFSAQGHYLLALVQWRRGHLDTAAGEFERAFTIDPSDDSIYTSYFTFLLPRDAAKAAGLATRRLDLYSAMLADHPRSPTYHERMAWLYSQSAQYDKAEQEYKAALQIDLSSPDLHNDLGIFYYRMDEYQQALDEFAAAGSLAPNEPVYKTNAGDMARSLGESEAASGNTDAANRQFLQAYNSYRAANEVDPEGNYHGHFGDLYLAQKKYDQAASEYEQIAEGQDLAFERLGNAYYAAGQYKDALSAYSRALCISPASTGYYKDMAYAYRHLQDYNAALKQVQTALALAPSDASLHNLLGLIYTDDLSQFAKGIAEYEMAVKLAPAVAVYRYNLGYSYYSQQKFSDAAVQFEAALEATLPGDTSRWEYAFYLGRAYEKLQQYDKARDALEEAVKLAPGVPEAQAWLAIVYNELGDPRACPTLATAIALADKSTDADTRQSAQDYRDLQTTWKCQK